MGYDTKIRASPDLSTWAWFKEHWRLLVGIFLIFLGLLLILRGQRERGAVEPRAIHSVPAFAAGTRTPSLPGEWKDA